VSDYQRIDVAEARLIAAREDAALLDVRAPEDFGQGHVDGARNVTEDNLPQLVEGLSKSAPLVIYCYHGNSSQMAARFFAAQGFSEVYSVDGGYEAWRAAS
jgi:thiosulfate sulfurtransferase